MGNPRTWLVYRCNRCGGLVTACATGTIGLRAPVQDYFPRGVRTQVAAELPERAQKFLRQAFDSTLAPSGAIMCAASAVDAMLKSKGFREGSLKSRIDLAADKGILTEDMKEWAHRVRLDANEQRHDDDDEPIADEADAKACLEFASTLGMLLFVLPERVKKGLEASKSPSDPSAPPKTGA